MIKIYQSKTVQVDGGGNCVAACLASLLEMPLRELPSVHPADDDFWMVWQSWLVTQGYRLNFVNNCQAPKGWGLATVVTDRIYPDGHDQAGNPILHMVVVYAGEVVHDPHPLGSAIKEIKYYWELIPKTLRNGE